MVNTGLLLKAIEQKGKTKESVAQAAEMNRSTFYRKIKCGGCGITIGEARKMISFIPLSKKEVHEIFLF